MITEQEATRLLNSGKSIIDPQCPPGNWYRMSPEFMLDLLLERGEQGYAVRETQTSIILFQPHV
jgi:hypothetical protein